MNNYTKLTAANLCKVYGKRKVVDDVSIEVSRGEVVGLLGPNGAGKTTTFYMITGMIRPASGTIALDSLDITSIPMYKRAMHKIGYLSQEPSVFTKLSVEDNIMLVLEMIEPSESKRKNRLDELLEEFSIAHIKKSQAYTLSGGERRRLEIARTLASKPNYLLLDEPLTGIDPVSIEEIKIIIKKLKNKNIGILITDHNVRETLKIVDKVYIVNEGSIFFGGDPKEAIKNEKIKKFYLGANFKI